MSASLTLSLSSPQVPQPITATITRLVTGSIHRSPVSRISTPATTTPTETSASAAMCRKAPRMLMSCLRPRMNISAVARVDDDADPGNHDHRHALDRRGVEQPVDRLEQDRAERHQQQPGVGQRGEDRARLVAVGEARVRRSRGHVGCAPGDQQAEHVRQVVPRIGDQRHRARQQPERRLDQHERRVEQHPDRERAAEVALRGAWPCPCVCGRALPPSTQS